MNQICEGYIITNESFFFFLNSQYAILPNQFLQDNWPTNQPTTRLSIMLRQYSFDGNCGGHLFVINMCEYILVWVLDLNLKIH